MLTVRPIYLNRVDLNLTSINKFEKFTLICTVHKKKMIITTSNEMKIGDSSHKKKRTLEKKITIEEEKKCERDVEVVSSNGQERYVDQEGSGSNAFSSAAQ